MKRLEVVVVISKSFLHELGLLMLLFMYKLKFYWHDMVQQGVIVCETVGFGNMHVAEASGGVPHGCVNHVETTKSVCDDIFSPLI